jgi:NTP pyrophosphatase (non-canonical NTP hydrolase)
MAMATGGLSKLIEECGEVIQVAAKLQAYPDGKHPDGAGDLFLRLEDELADLMAALAFVVEKHKLDEARMFIRGQKKSDLYKQWDSQT